MKLALLASAALVPSLLLLERVAAGDDARPIQIEYVAPAPPECPSVEAFRERVSADLAREPRAHTDWQFKARIGRAEDGYAATLSSESGTRAVRANTCDQAAAAIAALIAGVAPEPADTTPMAMTPQPPAEARSNPAADVEPAPRREKKTDWRVGARAQAWTHGAPSYGGPQPMSYGGMGVVSAEIPRGIFRRTLFEAAAGVMESNTFAEQLTYYVVDLQVCPVDVEFGHSGVSLLGCNRLAGAWFHTRDLYGDGPGGALWFGTGLRVRWQSESPIFVELHGNAVYGTVSGPENPDPGWIDVGAMAGARF